MATYKVTWEIEIDADTPEEAVMEAREIQLDDMSEATAFELERLSDGQKYQIDLGPMTRCKFCNGITPTNGGRYHEGEQVCATCWDERLRVTS